MSIRNGIYNTVALALGALAMASLLGTDAYSQAAGAEARGLKALSMQIELSCDEGPGRDADRLVLAGGVQA
jgi:hypothetical protein